MARILYKILNRGKSAKTFLDNEVFQKAVEQVRSDLLQEWAATKLNDTKTREKAYFATRALNDVIFRLSNFITEADYEREMLRKEIELKKKAQDKRKKRNR